MAKINSASLFPILPQQPIGIARMAAAAKHADDGNLIEFKALEVRSILNRNVSRRTSWIAYSINPYRGCEFGCKYCYARYAHEFMELRDPELFERKIYAKQFRPVAFRAELRRLKSGDTVWIGTATDPYQPAERRFNITHQMLEALVDERGLDIGVTTKSDLVARDAALMSRIARKTRVRVHMTITTLDERLARLLEPLAPRPSLRLAA